MTINNAKLTRGNVEFIRQKSREGMSDKDIHEMFFTHVKLTTVADARCGRTWSQVPGAVPNESAGLAPEDRRRRREGLIHALSMVDNQIDRALASGFSRASSYVEGLRENRRKLTAEQIDLEDTMRKRGEL